MRCHNLTQPQITTKMDSQVIFIVVATILSFISVFVTVPSKAELAEGETNNELANSNTTENEQKKDLAE